MEEHSYNKILVVTSLISVIQFIVVLNIGLVFSSHCWRVSFVLDPFKRLPILDNSLNFINFVDATMMLVRGMS